jgi:hypothetical protein
LRLVAARARRAAASISLTPKPARVSLLLLAPVAASVGCGRCGHRYTALRVTVSRQCLLVDLRGHCRSGDPSRERRFCGCSNLRLKETTHDGKSLIGATVDGIQEGCLASFGQFGSMIVPRVNPHLGLWFMRGPRSVGDSAKPPCHSLRTRIPAVYVAVQPV